MMIPDKVIQYAKEQGYDSVEKSEPWNGFDVYVPIFEGDEMSIVGLPLVVLVKGEKIRMSTPDEAFQIIDRG